MRSRCVARIAAVLALAASCGPSVQGPTTIVDFVAENDATEVKLDGHWEGAGYSFFVVPEGRGYLVLLVKGESGRGRRPVSATSEGGVLVLEERLDDIERFHLCRLDDAEVLLAEPGTTMEGGRPVGFVFERTGVLVSEEEQEEEVRLYLPGPEDENPPVRRWNER